MAKPDRMDVRFAGSLQDDPSGNPSNQSKRPRVLFLDQYARMGGGQRILLDIAEHFASHGFTCCAALTETGPLEGLLHVHGISTRQIAFPDLTSGRKSWRDQLAYVPATQAASKQIVAIAEDFRADLIFCNGPRLMPSAVSAATRLGLPLVCAVHLIFAGKERALLSWCFRKRAVRAVTFCSSAAASAFPHLPAQKRQLVGNWVSPQFATDPVYMNAKTSFGLRDDAIAVGVVGRLSSKKGQRLFLEAIAPILKARPNMVAVLAGSSDFEDPTEEDRLRKMALNLDISEQTHFLGNVSNTVELMDALDILVVPSVWEEPFGLVAVEGMARGLPVIATKSGGLVDIVDDGVTGTLVDKTPEGLRFAVEALVEDETLRARMGAAGRLRSETTYAAEPRLEGLAKVVFSHIDRGIQVRACRGKV